jgi:hypothetical protein
LDELTPIPDPRPSPSTELLASEHSALREELRTAFEKISDPRKRGYLLAVSISPSLRDAARVAQVSPYTAYNWRRNEKDSAFQEAFKIARDLAIEEAEGEAWNRGVHGWDEPVFGQMAIPETVETKDGDERVIFKKFTGIVGHKKIKSDTMLIFMLKAAKPDVYRDRVEHTGIDGGPIQTQVIIQLPDNGRPRRLPEST